MLELPLTITEKLSRTRAGRDMLRLHHQLDAEHMHNHARGLIEWPAVEKWRAWSAANLEAFAALEHAELTKARAGKIATGERRPGISADEQRNKYDSKLPWRIIADSTLTKADRRVLAALKWSAGTEREVNITYVELAHRAKVCRRQAILSCKKLRHRYVNWQEQRLTPTLSEPNTFKLTDETFQGFGLPVGTPARRPAGAKNKSAEPCTLQGEAKASLSDVDKSRSSSRRRSRKVAARPEPRAPKSDPDGSLRSPELRAKGGSASAVPNSPPPAPREIPIEGEMQTDPEDFSRPNYQREENYGGKSRPVA
jgi:hypothetical protein